MRFRFQNLIPLLLVTTFLGVSSLVFSAYRRSALVDAARVVCWRVAQEYVHADRLESSNWVSTCLAEADEDVDRSLKSRDPKRELINQINNRLSFFRVSHMAAFAPEETIGTWTGESVDTGARARLIDGEIVITRLIPGSPAKLAGVRRGDLVVSIDGVVVGQPEEIEMMPGLWEIVRKDNTKVQLPVNAVSLVDPIQPYVENGNVLRFPTFLPESMSDENLDRLKQELSGVRSLVIDIRKNRGGSFPAMVRAASLFLCKGAFLGWVSKRPIVVRDLTVEQVSGMPLEDDLATDLQLSKLERFGGIGLRTHVYDRCYNGPLVVLTDEGTASVAEIFALAMKERPSTLVLGWSTAGKVVMSQWFSISPLGPDYTVSIPVALYRSAKGEELEHRGVSPDEILRDRLVEWRSGVDPWVVDALSRMKSVSK